MAGLGERETVGLRTKLLFVAYLASGLIGLVLFLWSVVVLLVYFVSGEDALQSFPVAFLFPWVPLAALVMLVAKFALVWSSRKDRRSGTK